MIPVNIFVNKFSSAWSPRVNRLDKDIITLCCIDAAVTFLFFGNAITRYSRNNTS